MPKRLVESQALTITEADTTTGRLQIGIITPGWGSSGYYSPKVLENAAAAKVFPAGTQMFLDHPGEAERHDRPERSVRDLAAVLAEDAVWDGNGLVAEAKVFSTYRDLLTDPDLAEAIGVSIRAAAEVTTGEAEGRKGVIVTELTEAQSVDFVTKAGRGGRVLAVLESARAQATEATAGDTRQALHAAVKAAHGDDDTYTWVRDFDPDQNLVWFDVEDGDSTHIYQQGYTQDQDGTAASLTGERTEVRARTEYVPVTSDATEASHQPPVAPAGSTPTHESPEEDTMPQIEESRLAQLEADAGRVQTAEESQRAAEQRAETAEAAARTASNRAAAIEAITESGHTFTKLERRGLLAELPTTTDGTLDTEAFTKALDEAAADTAPRGVTGFGRTDDDAAEVTESDADVAVARAFGRTVKEA